MRAAVEMKNRSQYMPRFERFTSMQKNFGKNRGAAPKCPQHPLLYLDFSTSVPFTIFAGIVWLTHNAFCLIKANLLR
jgi:hypothetical protein